MLADLLAEHPDTSRDVLAVLATSSHAHASTYARIRLGWEEPWGNARGSTAVNVGLLPILLHPNLTAAQLRAWVTVWPTGAWSDALTSHQLTSAALRTVTSALLTRSNTRSAGKWAQLIALHPNCPADLAANLLARVEHQADAATILAIIDNHQLPEDVWPAALHGTSDHRARRVLNAYRAAGSLAALWSTERSASNGTLDPADLDWGGILDRTANTEFALILARTVIDTASAHTYMHAADDLQRLLLSDGLPQCVFPDLARLLLPATRHVSPQLKRSATIALYTQLDQLDGWLLDQVVPKAPRTTARIALATNPNLTDRHIRHLLDQVTARNIGASDLYSFAHLARHPNATARTRERAINLLSSDTNHTGAPVRMLARAARNEPLITAELPAAPNAPIRTALAPLVSPYLSQHKALFTDPDLTRAVLTLAPTYTGTLDTLVATAAGIVS